MIVYLCLLGSGGAVTQESFELLNSRFSWRDWPQAAQLQIWDLSSTTFPHPESNGWRFDMNGTSARTSILEFGDSGEKDYERESQILISISAQRLLSFADLEPWASA
jgi:hypothetical protein